MPVVDRDQFPSIEWREIIGLRQHVVHGYDKVDLDILDGVMRGELPTLRASSTRSCRNHSSFR